MVRAVATTTVPKFTVIVGGCYGAGAYAMSNSAYAPRFVWAWPNSRVAVMGGDQLQEVMATVSKCVLSLSLVLVFRKLTNMVRELVEILKQLRNSKHRLNINQPQFTLLLDCLFFFPPLSTPHPTSSLVTHRWDDGVIAPSDTRSVLGLGIAVAMKSWDPVNRERGNMGVFRMVS